MSWSDWNEAGPAWPAPYLEWADEIFPQFSNEDKYSRVLDPVSIMKMYGIEVPQREKDLCYFPVPKEICNPGFNDFHKDRRNATDWLTAGWGTSLPLGVDDDTIIAAIIDVDIGFGHRRFRDKDGKSRVLAAWQQSDKWHDRGSPGVPRDAGLPFGRTLLQKEIDNYLVQHSLNGLRSKLDEWSFNHATGLAHIARPYANKGLLKGFAHGTHVLGLLGGACPEDEAEFAERVKFIVVNLPPSSLYGEGGGFLDYFLGYGLRWVTEVYGRLTDDQSPKDKTPLVVNISFGKQAGPKDEQQEFVRALVDNSEALNPTNGDQNGNMEMLNVFMPAGNDNLSKGHASGKLKPNETREIVWVISPDDETSNFVEIWLECPKRKRDYSPLQLDVVPPGTKNTKFQGDPIRHKRDLLGGSARIYLHEAEPIKKKSDNATYSRYRYVICQKSFAGLHGNARGAPSGRWRIRMHNSSRHEVSVRMHIQTDAGTGPSQKVIRASYFDDPNYIRTEYSGRLADTYTYATGKRNKKDLDKNSFVRRHGTLNSYAANRYVITVGGYRLSDGRPVPYSGTGFGIWYKGRAIGAPQILFPSEDGYAHFGILTDGATDGSTVAVSGTSFASACAARFVIQRWIDGNPGPRDREFSVKDILESQTQSCEGANFFYFRRVDKEKAGTGRLEYQPERSVTRLDWKQ